jgi:hypothetical protein
MSRCKLKLMRHGVAEGDYEDFEYEGDLAQALQKRLGIQLSDTGSHRQLRAIVRPFRVTEKETMPKHFYEA